jgi:hypothetical protein
MAMASEGDVCHLTDSFDQLLRIVMRRERALRLDIFDFEYATGGVEM